MKMIDMVLGAYIARCLFPMGEDAQSAYIYEALRGSRSHSENEAFQHVLDFIRQEDPADPETQKVVRQYLMGWLANAHPRFTAEFRKVNGYYSFTIREGDKHIGFAVSTEEGFQKCCETLKQEFQDILITQIS